MYPDREFRSWEAEIDEKLRHTCWECQYCRLPSEQDIYNLDETIGWCEVIKEFVNPKSTAYEMECEDIYAVRKRE